MIEIDKGIPIPRNMRSPRSKYPWPDMEVGDSFFVAGHTAAERDRLREVNALLLEALNGLAFPSHGEHGGPLTCIVAMYEDGTEQQLGHEPNVKARAAIAEGEGK